MGEISDLTVHPKFPLEVDGKKVAVYIADFSYYVYRSDIHLRSAIVVVDVKGVKTAIYKLKKRLMKICHGIEIQEV